MLEQAVALLNILISKKFEAYFIGGKCRNELNNQYNGTKIAIKDIDIVTSATPQELLKIFPSAKTRGESFQVVVVTFGGEEFEISTYRKDIYSKVSKGKIEKPETIVANTLDEDRERRDFTINAIAQDKNKEYIDFKYKYRNKQISAINDIKNGIIRAIGTPRQRFEEDPLRILRAFRFVAQLGYEIEKGTMKAILSNLNLLSLIPEERIGMEFNKIIVGKYANKAINLMAESGVFNIKTKNGKILLSGLSSMESIDEKHFNDIKKLNHNTPLEILETWAYLLKPLGADEAKENLESINPMSKEDIERVHWLISNYDLINEKNMKLAILNARTGIIKRKKLICMKNLLINLCNIHEKLIGKEFIKTRKHVIDSFCSRPYFEEQLPVDGEKLMEITKLEPGPWISEVKEKLIYNLVILDEYPQDEKIEKVIIKSIKEVIS